MKKYFYVLTMISMLISCQTKSQSGPPEDDLDILFEEKNKNELSSVANIASKDEPGERIHISGTVYLPDGKTPAKNVLLYFYHTNAKGIYAKRGNEPRTSAAWWHGYNRGWLITGADGKYEINTIKPAPYPARIEPAHIHVVVKAPTQKKAYDVGAITFKGDDLATPEYWYQVEQNGHPRDGGTELKKNARGILEGKRDFILYAQYDVAAKFSGLRVGEDCPAFTPIHAFGQDKGSKACPMCKYGYKEGIMVWLNSDDWKENKALAHNLEKIIAEKGIKQFRVFIMYMNPRNLSIEAVSQKLNLFSKEAGLKQVALLHFTPEQAAKTFSMYQLNRHPGIKNTVMIFRNRHVAGKFINITSSDNDLTLLYNSIENKLPQSTARQQ